MPCRSSVLVLAAVALALLAGFAPGLAPANTPVDVVWRDGLRLRATTDDGDIEIRVGGRIHLDSTFGFADLDAGASGNAFEPIDGIRIRRARLQLRGSFLKAATFNLQMEFSSGAVVFKDAYLGFAAGPGTLLVGLQKASFSLDNWIGANSRPMMESNFVKQLFAPSAQLGLSYQASLADDLFHAHVSVFRGTNGTANLTPDEDVWLAGARLWLSPLNDDDTADLHLGLSVNHWFLHDDAMGFRTRPAVLAEPGGRPLSRTVAGLSGSTLFGFEAALAAGAVRVMAEFGGARTSSQDAAADGLFLWAVSATVGYLLNGGTQNYNAADGKIVNPKVDAPFGADGSPGLFEVLIGFDYGDIGDGATGNGLAALQVALGLNWYLNNNMRVMWDFALMNLDGDGTYYLMGLRFQVAI